MKRAMVVLSGGQDSTTCLFAAKRAGYELYAVTFDYGQRHRRELEAARIVAALAGVVDHEVVKLGPVLQGTSPLVSGAELEQYSDHKSLPGGLEKTFVPMRNQLFLTIAANRAYVKECDLLYTGVCQEDYGGYPDCRQVFIDALGLACNLGTFTGEPGTRPNLEIATPLMNLTKAQSIHLALEIQGCYGALAYTHTSYDGQYPPTGHDHATLLREKGFEEAGIPDPLIIRAYLENYLDDMPWTENYRGAVVRSCSHLVEETMRTVRKGINV